MEIGVLDWASPQDWMCEPQMLAHTGLTVAEHQRRTVENLLTLRGLAADLPFIPVVQGWEIGDYSHHVQMYAAAGMDLGAEALVGVGSVCRRQSAWQIGEIARSLHGMGLSLHGFGVKIDGLRRYADRLTSCDSMAWSYWGRRDPKTPGCQSGARTCAHCVHYALAWRARLLAVPEPDPTLF